MTALENPMDAFRLDDRTAVVTGGASGIGEAAARTLAAAGASVVIGDVNIEAAEQVATEIAQAGGRAIARAADITSKEQVDALVDTAAQEFGSVDVMANVAGIASDGPIVEVTEAEADRLLAINIKGTLFGCQAALRHMVEQKSGSIINVASASIDVAAPGYGMYALTKAAVAQLTMTLAVEHGKHGIRVNTIAPGSTITPFTARHAYNEDGTLNQEKYDEFVKRMEWISPLRRVGEAMDQAYLILYLASEASRFCTGQVWRANGGQAIVR